MPLHADQLLFPRKQSTEQVSVGALLLVCAVLVVNGIAHSPLVSKVGLCIAIGLLLVNPTRGLRRLGSVVLWLVALLSLSFACTVLLSFDRIRVLETGTRIACGVSWVLWLGTVLDFRTLRLLLIRLKVPEPIVASLDQSVLHGLLTQSEWKRRRDAARLRKGGARLPMRVWGHLVAEGALSGFDRLEQVGRSTSLRAALSSDNLKKQSCELREAFVERGDRILLEPASLHVAAGEWIALCGPSGAGKSTLLKLLAGVLGPTGGCLERLGRSIDSRTTLKHRLDGRVALLFQNPEQHFIETSVVDEITWGLRARKMGAAETRRRIEEVSEGLGISDLLDRPCHQLSFGEQRRVALAGLLVLEPDMLLLDEPTSGLDPVSAHALRRSVRDLLAVRKASCVWATHDLVSWPDEIRRVVLLRAGRVVFDGPREVGLSATWLAKAGLLALQL